MRNEDLFQIIFEDADLLVINKPAGLVCHPTKTDAYSSLISRARLYLGPDSHPQLINRLDRETSGVTLIAKTDTAARELRRLWERRAVSKEYVSIVHGHLSVDSGIVDLPLGKDEHSRVAIKDCVRPDGSPARTHFQVQRRFNKRADGRALPFTLVTVRPETGRKHQIRIHLAHSGHPIVGDKLYGPDEDCYLALVENRMSPEQQAWLMLPFQALHASQLSFSWRGTEHRYAASPETWFVEFYSSGLSNSIDPSAAPVQDKA